MKLQLLLHKADADSVCGYDTPLDLSESILGMSFDSLEDLRSIIQDAGFTDTPYTVLFGGHPVDELEVNDDSGIRHRTILAVPKDPVVRILLPNREWISSVKSYQITVKDLKGILHQLLEDPVQEILIIDKMGEILNDTSSLLSVQCFDYMNPLVCREQINEYVHENSQTVRMHSVFGQARSLQHQWCALGDVGDEIEQVRQMIASKLKSSFRKSSALIGADVSLQVFTYDRFKQDFPPESAPDLADSDQLARLKSLVAQSTGRHSASPAGAQTIIETLTTDLKRTNLKYANQYAQLLSTLVEPLGSLANKRPMVHDHDGYHEKLKKVERSMNNYRDIMAGKMFNNPDELQQRGESLVTLREVYVTS